MLAQDGCQPRTGAPAKVQDTPVATKVIDGGEGLCRGRLDGLDPFGKNLLCFFGKVQRTLGLASANGVFQLRPCRVAKTVPEAQERAQVGGSAASQKGRSDRGILIRVPVPIDEAQDYHGIRQDAQPAPSDTRTPGEFVQ